MTAPLPTAPVQPAKPPAQPDPTATVDPAADPTAPEPDPVDPADDPEGADQLGDAGKKALDAMKAKWQKERDARRAAEAKLTDTAKPAPSAEDKPDVDKIRSDAETAATAKANVRIIRSELKAAAATKLADPSDAAAFIDLTQFEVDADGNVDEDELNEAIADLLVKKPHLAKVDGAAPRPRGSADGGVRKTEKKTLDQEIAEAQAKGDAKAVIRLQNRKFAATQT